MKVWRLPRQGDKASKDPRGKVRHSMAQKGFPGREVAAAWEKAGTMAFVAMRSVGSKRDSTCNVIAAVWRWGWVK